ncbi:MAG TPA: permease-like cell division protein FtsX [Candidatus Deferrimicrobium sp.]|nr:permease-like cell division protein FtsX [Candidatus Kapabacteria bacterium]HLP57184.1 permease-like cell division protein FtsX [Candidatus Deferrimicrobium sp.]
MNLLQSTLKNAFISITRNKLINFLSFGIIAFTLLIFGIFNYLTYSLETFTNEFTRNIEAIFYFKDNVEQPEIDLLVKKLKESLLVENIAFNSRDQAEIIFSRQFPELQYILSEFKTSPFPASIEVKFKQEYNIGTQVISFIEDIEKLSIVESKQVNLDWAKKVMAIKKFISLVGMFLSMILIFVSAFIIFNLIKLNIFYRKEEITIYRLVGATDWYIKIPFIIEGALLGFFGSLMACGLLFITLKLFPAYATFMYNIFKDMVSFKNIPPALFLRLLLLGTGIGLSSSYISVRQFLKN